MCTRCEDLMGGQNSREGGDRAHSFEGHSEDVYRV